MPAHSALTGADLHEPKGAASAGLNTVYIANGSGSGAWQKVGANQIDTTSLFNANEMTLTYTYRDIGTAGSKFVPISKAVAVERIVVVLDLLTATAATVLTFKNSSGVSMGTISIPSGATAGTVYTLAPSSNNVIAADTKLQIDTDGGTSSTSDVTIAFNLLITA